MQWFQLFCVEMTPAVEDFKPTPPASPPAEQARGDSSRQRQQDLQRQLLRPFSYAQQPVHGRLRELRHLLSREAAAAEDGRQNQNSVHHGLFGEVQTGGEPQGFFFFQTLPYLNPFFCSIPVENQGAAAVHDVSNFSLPAGDGPQQKRRSIRERLLQQQLRDGVQGPDCQRLGYETKFGKSRLVHQIQSNAFVFSVRQALV